MNRFASLATRKFVFGPSALILVFLFMPVGDLLAESVRLAVISDPTLANLTDAVTLDLSKDTSLSVLERADIDKLGQEAVLQAAVNSNDFSAVQPLPADGLILLRAVKIDGKTNVLARLVAVQPGVVLREIALPTSNDVLDQAQAVAPAFAAFWPKLAAVAKGNATAVSLLGLRFETDAPETRELERQVNLLLANRLSAEPGAIVLERWRLSDAVFEKSLVANPSSFWTGSSLIDGSMTWDKTTNRVNVSLRMRPAQGASVSLSDADTTDHLADLIGRLADKIQAHPAGSSGSWQPAAEAAHYAELGKWCLDNLLFDEGAPAIESALALGDNSTATHCLQIRAYTSLAYPDEAPDTTNFSDPNAKPLDPESVPDRVKSGSSAVGLISRYLSAAPKASGQVAISEDPVTLGLKVVDNDLRLLRFAYEKGFAGTDKDDVTTLRHDVQNLLKTLDASGAKMPSSARDTLLKYEVRYAPFWHESPEETIDYYRELLNRKTDGVAIRDELFVDFYVSLHPVYLPPEDKLKLLNPTNDGEMLNLGDWAVGSPRVIAWDDRTADDVVAKWNDFLRELNASPDPVLQSDAIKFQSCPVYTLGEQNLLLGRFMVEFLEKNKESFFGPRGNDLIAGLDTSLSLNVYQDPDKANLNRLRNLGEVLLQQRAILSSVWLRHMPKIYDQAPPDLAARVLASLDDYCKWYQTQAPQDPEMIEALEQARKPLAVYAGVPGNGQSEGAQGGNDFITVNRRWPQSLPELNGNNTLEAMKEKMQSIAYSLSMITAEDKVWTVMMGGKLIKCVDPSTLQTVETYTVPLQDNHDPTRPPSVFLGVTPQFLVVSIAGQVMLCSRSDQSWRTLDVPPSNYKPCWVNQQLYLIYDAGLQLKPIQEETETADSAISGLIHVSLPDGGIENLVSTRRIPPQSPLDGKPMGFPLNLWSSSNGLNLAVLGNAPRFQIFSTPVGKNNWAPVTSDSVLSDAKISDGGVLVGKEFDDHGFAQLVLMNGTDSQVLLSNPNRAPSGSKLSTRWHLPDDFLTMSPKATVRCSAVMRGKDLCFYSVRKGDTEEAFDACLYYFVPGQKSGVKIPLKFSFPASTDPGSEKRAAAQPVIHDFQSLQSTKDGLIVIQELMVGGFCMIPWSDIDACRAHASSANPPKPVVPLSVTVPTEPAVTATPTPALPPAPTVTSTPTPAPQPAVPPAPTVTATTTPAPPAKSKPISSPPEVD